jgi:isoquinoline 1-oxidoreductase alpha subunit
MPVTLIVNDQSRTLDVDPQMPLLWAIRDHLQLTGTKFGCGMAIRMASAIRLRKMPFDLAAARAAKA